MGGCGQLLIATKQQLACFYRELLEKIAHFEQENLSSLATPLHKKQLLEPINSAGGDKLLKLVRH